jgi:hypothetical protein
MAGGGVKKRHAAKAIRAYHLRNNGLTNRQIAELVGRKIEQVPGLIKQGERLVAQSEPPATSTPSQT